MDRCKQEPRQAGSSEQEATSRRLGVRNPSAASSHQTFLALPPSAARAACATRTCSYRAAPVPVSLPARATHGPACVALCCLATKHGRQQTVPALTHHLSMQIKPPDTCYLLTHCFSWSRMTLDREQVSSPPCSRFTCGAHHDKKRRDGEASEVLLSWADGSQTGNIKTIPGPHHAPPLPPSPNHSQS